LKLKTIQTDYQGGLHDKILLYSKDEKEKKGKEVTKNKAICRAIIL